MIHSPVRLVDECERRALALLRQNLGPDGVLACTPGPAALARHYTSVFGRDAAMCALGMVASGEADLVSGACAGLVTLARHQAPSGEIPKFVDPATGEADFWYVGCADATAWWLLAVHFFDRHAPGSSLGESLGAEIRRAIAWLQAQQHPRWGLVRQNEASDWADIMPRSGFVLYTNALWYAVKARYALPGLEATAAHAALLFDPYADDAAAHRRIRLLRDYARGDEARPWRSFVDFAARGDEGDVLGNVLAGLFGLMPAPVAREVVDALRAAGVAAPGPVRVVLSPLDEGHPRWRAYMDRHGQNRPHQYHNGGVWPFAGALWALLLDRVGLPGPAREALAGVAALCAREDWGFCEWFHGETGAAAGMRGQSWNAALYVLARRVLDGGLRLGVSDGTSG